MLRYRKLVRKLDRGEITIREFLIEARKKVGDPLDEPITDAEACVMFMIYKEDGGKWYSFEDFMKAVEKRTLPEWLDLKALTYEVMTRYI